MPLRMMCRDEAATAAVASVGRRRRRTKNVVATDTGAAAPRRAAVVPLNKQRDDDAEQEGLTARAGRRCAGKAVSWAGGVGDDAAGKAPAATVKIMLRRKDAEALVARLNAQSARERKARMAEIKGELRAGECCGGASPAACRDAWRPQLAPIKEN